jgi:hypothetical protein
MAEDKNCKPWEKPYYHVWEAAAFWCGITNRTISIDDKGIPVADPQNECLRSRAIWIMDAIVSGELPCGRDGKSVPGEAITGCKRTVRRIDLRNWFLENHGERPPFLFDEIERKTHAAINAESFLVLQADLQAKKTRLEKTEERLREMAIKNSALEHERDAAIRSFEESVDARKAVGEREKNSYLHLIGALLQIIMDKKLYETEEGLREDIAEQYKGFPGCTFRTTAGRFADAKRLLSQ